MRRDARRELCFFGIPAVYFGWHGRHVEKNGIQKTGIPAVGTLEACLEGMINNIKQVFYIIVFCCIISNRVDAGKYNSIGIVGGTERVVCDFMMADKIKMIYGREDGFNV